MQSVCFTSAEQVLHVGVGHRNAEKPAQADGLGSARWRHQAGPKGRDQPVESVVRNREDETR